MKLDAGDRVVFKALGETGRKAYGVINSFPGWKRQRLQFL